MLGSKTRIYICFAIINLGVYLIQAAVASDVNSQGKNGNLQQSHGELKDTLTEKLQKFRNNNWKMVIKALERKDNAERKNFLVLATSRKAENQIFEGIKKTSGINSRENAKAIQQKEDPEIFTANSKSLPKNLMVLATSRKAENQISEEIKKVSRINSRENVKKKDSEIFTANSKSFRKNLMVLATSRKAENPISQEIKANSRENLKEMRQENNPEIFKNIEKNSFVLATSRNAQNPKSKEIKKTLRINSRENVKKKDPEIYTKNSKRLLNNLMVLATSRTASNRIFGEFKEIFKENFKDSSKNVCKLIVKHVKTQKNFKIFTNIAQDLPKNALVWENSKETGNLKNVKGFLHSFTVKGSKETVENLKQDYERLLRGVEKQCSKGKGPKNNKRRFENVREAAEDLKSSENPVSIKLFGNYTQEGKHKQLSTALPTQHTKLSYEGHRPTYSVEERQTQDLLHVSKNPQRSKCQEVISIKSKALQPAKVFKLNVHQGMNRSIFQLLAKILTLSNLQMMKSFAQIRTVILIGSCDVLGMALKIFNYNYPPIVVVTHVSQWEFKDYHNKQILALVFLKETLQDSLEILEILTSTLYRLHMRKVVFIVPQLGQYEKDLVEWCFTKGFWNSLFMDYEGRALAYDFLAQEYKNNLTLEEFLRLSIYWRDLKGFKVRCLMANNPPRAYIFNNTEGRIDYRGYYGTILTIFAKHYNATLVPVILSDTDTYRELDCIEYLQQNVVDLCGDALTAGFTRAYAVTNPEEMTTCMLMVPHDKGLPKYLYFFKPFQLHVWTIVIISFLYKILTLAFIHRIQHGFWNASLQIGYATLSVIHLPFNLTQVKGKYRRFLELLFISVGFVISNWYLAVLSSVLFTSLYHQGIDSLEDLKRYNISIMVNEFEYYQLHNMANHPIIMQQLMLVSNDVLRQHRSNLDMNYAYYNQYDKIYLYLYQQKYLLRPRMKILQNAEPMNPVLGVLPLQTNWPFEHLLNLVLRSSVDYGFYIKILEDGMLDGIRQGHIKYFATEYPSVDPLSVEHFNMPALILLVGYVLALMGFIAEIMVFKIKNKNFVN